MNNILPPPPQHTPFDQGGQLDRDWQIWYDLIVQEMKRLRERVEELENAQ